MISVGVRQNDANFGIGTLAPGSDPNDPPMPRYMPQHVFDSLVIVRAMVDLTRDERIFHDAIRQYVAMYPGEHAQALSDDVSAAAVTAWELTRLIVQLRPSENDDSSTALLHSVLQELRDNMHQRAQSDRVPAKIPGGSVFNSSPTALPDRIDACRKHLGLACQEVLSNARS